MKSVKMMSLEEFVKGSLAQIINGVAEAQKEVEEKGLKAGINPKGITGAEKIGFCYDYSSGNPIQMIEFDVAVTVSEEKNNEAGIGIKMDVYKLFSATGEVKAGSGREDIGIHRIKFKVPVLFPIHKRGKS